MIVIKRTKSNKKKTPSLLKIIPLSDIQVKSKKKKNKRKLKKLTKKSVKILKSLGYSVKQK